MPRDLFLDGFPEIPDEAQIIALDDLPFDDEGAVQKVGNRTYFLLIIYDIVDNKRRTKLARTLEGFGVRVQFSAFECHLVLSEINELNKKIKPLIDESEDSLRVYRMPSTTKIDTMGRMGRTYAEEVVII